MLRLLSPVMTNDSHILRIDSQRYVLVKLLYHLCLRCMVLQVGIRLVVKTWTFGVIYFQIYVGCRNMSHVLLTTVSTGLVYVFYSWNSIGTKNTREARSKASFAFVVVNGI